MHRPYGRFILLDNRVHRPTALLNVPLQPPYKTNVGRRIHVNLHIKQVAQSGLGKNQNAFHQYDRMRFDEVGLLGPFVAAEIVYRNFHRLPMFEPLQMYDEQIGVERIGMIEVDRIPLGQWKIIEIAVVRVVRKQRDVLGADATQNDICDRGFARSGSTRDADYQRRRSADHGGIIRCGPVGMRARSADARDLARGEFLEFIGR